VVRVDGGRWVVVAVADGGGWSVGWQMTAVDGGHSLRGVSARLAARLWSKRTRRVKSSQAKSRLTSVGLIEEEEGGGAGLDGVDQVKLMEGQAAPHAYTRSAHVTASQVHAWRGEESAGIAC
jgi:hypothetical protein